MIMLVVKKFKHRYICFGNKEIKDLGKIKKTLVQKEKY